MASGQVLGYCSEQDGKRIFLTVMIFFSILFALLIEHFRPTGAYNPLFVLERYLAARIEGGFNAGHQQHGRFAWFVLMSVLVIPILVIYGILLFIHPLFGLIWNVTILYLCLSFRCNSKSFSMIQRVLLAGDEFKASSLLAEWKEGDITVQGAEEISRMAIEKVLLESNTSSFGVFFWFLLPLGPAGAVFYQVSAYLAKAWNQEPDDAFGDFAKRAFYWIDYIPVRLTAVAFAIVGNFEDAVYAWRNFANRWQEKNIGIILATGGGAIGVRLGNPAEKASEILPVDVTSMESLGIETEGQPGEEPNPRFMQNALGLIWRALLLWLLMLFLFTIVMWFA